VGERSNLNFIPIKDNISRSTTALVTMSGSNLFMTFFFVVMMISPVAQVFEFRSRRRSQGEAPERRLVLQTAGWG
jgi:hypothetical protein